ncbi:MAG TPA: endo-1,4-beta-xylanase [Opitutaceae bacterium]
MSTRNTILPRIPFTGLTIAAMLASACSKQPETSQASTASSHAQAHVPTLKDAYKDAFLVGAALNLSQVNEEDARHAELIRTQFNTITPENLLKWENVHPEPNKYDFEPADRYVALGEKHGMFIIGHALVWHNQTPDWVFQDESGNPATREALLDRMRDHIHTVVGRYKGRINGWDVVNEAINDKDGSMRDSPWRKIIGDDFIENAFTFAHEADPDAELQYNDYSLADEPKRKGVVAMIKKLQAAGVPITGVGLQQHNKMEWPTTQQIEATIKDFADLGLKVMITELDIDVLPAATGHRGADVTLNVELQERLNPYAGGLPDAVEQALAKRYAEVFGVYYKHRDAITRVTLWGVTDAESWLNDWPVRGRTSYPLLFNRDGSPKPAFDAVIKVPQSAN